MSLSKVNICNMALASLGASPIIGLDADTKEAKALSRFYDPARQAVLAEGEWTFADKYATLAESALENKTLYEYMYILPADCLKPLHFVEYPSYPFEKSGKFLYCNLSPVTLKYTYDIEDTSAFSTGFTRALSARLASDLAVYMKNQDAQAYIQKYEYELAKGKGQDVVYQRNRKGSAYPVRLKRFEARGSRWLTM